MSSYDDLDAEIIALDARREQQEARPPEYSDDALALRFADLHTNDLRYVALWGKWLCWDGACWRFDDTLAAYSLVRKVCRATAAACNTPRLAPALASVKTVAAVANLARSDRRLAATVDQWDTDLWSLNTPDGVLDLRSGRLRVHRAADYQTKITAVAPDADSSTPTWLAFLEKITNRDSDLIAFLQRMTGYAMTGSTQEHALFFLHGVGANGKSTFINAITGIVGDYHTTAPIETFTASAQERHPTDLAGLRGARLVSAIETEEGRKWAESKIKALTGGDRIAARFMRQDFFQYVPSFKLVIAGNHKPGLRSVDEAMRRRFNLIPFTVTIPPHERDQQIGDKLKAEWSGILAWMVEGCIAWQRDGLNPPKAVTVATSAYLDSQDAIAAWIDDQCERKPNAWERTKILFASWKAWAERSGEICGDTKTFRDRLEARGIFHKPEPGTKRAGYQGLALKPPEEPQAEEEHPSGRSWEVSSG